MRCLGRGLLFVLIVLGVAILGGILWIVIGGLEATADLVSVVSDVERWDAVAAAREPVGAGEHRRMRADDGVTVNQAGRARLDMGGCVLQIYRSTGLEVQGLPAESAGACVLQLTHGTLYNRVEKKTIVNTEWAVITALGTDFFVHLDVERGLLWVIVTEGVVEIQAAGQTVLLGAGQQAWVRRGEPPEPPRPAARAEVGDLFPRLEDLTNGELPDTALLAPGGQVPTPVPPTPVRPTPVPPTQPPPTEPPPTPEPPGLTLDQDVDVVINGECSGPETINIVATLSGPTESIALVSTAVVRYAWEDVVAGPEEMERVDDYTFVIEIGPFDYCCGTTPLTFTVEVLDENLDVWVSRSGGAEISYCIG